MPAVNFSLHSVFYIQRWTAPLRWLI